MRWYRLCFAGTVLLLCVAIVVASISVIRYRQIVREVAAIDVIQTEFSVSNLQEGSFRIEGATNYVTFEKLEEMAPLAKWTWVNHRTAKQEDDSLVKSLLVYLELPDSAMPMAGRIDIVPEGELGHHFWKLETFDLLPEVGKISMFWRAEVDWLFLVTGMFGSFLLLVIGLMLGAIGRKLKENYVAQKTRQALPPTGGLA